MENQTLISRSARLGATSMAYGHGAADELAKGFHAALHVLGKTPHGPHSNH